MGVISNNELQGLNDSRHILIRQLDRHEISFDKYLDEINKLNIRVSEITKNLINEEREKIEVKLQQDKSEVQKMVEEQKEKKGSGKRKGSRADYIEKALCKKSIKNKEQAADKVLELGAADGKQFDRQKTINQIGAILRDVKKGENKRWKGYTWNAEEYLLIAPGQE